ncbi:metal-dependent hydrolase [Aquisalibacillus elongatus]|uniref:L-ascorbate metabolism protein UlaG (Beta-lactamase superfamily) n=1 Tax=Aquisalibacillus elongatus TaxID=485577 RepID=A0A3N5B1Q8_9BACI|nr:metal-dependent hydrolase [Aquisalibacillus elongatus]RPF51079.1 L-ascorbate metabolism protein UlaG (beta-lactamase superfamily) [Aquisalibacillus elongatus]
MKIQRLGHAMYLFTSEEGHKYLVDPFVDLNPGFPQLLDSEEFYQSIDAILLTHGHFDHTSGLSKFVEHNPNVMIVAQYELALILLQQGLQNVMPINLGGSVFFEDVKVTMVQALHTSSYKETQSTPIYAGESSGYILDFTDDHTVYHSGDTAIMSDMKLIQDVYQPSIAILSSSGHFTMGPKEAAYAVKHLLDVDYVVPSHTFPTKQTSTSPELLEALLNEFPVVENMIGKDQELQKHLEDYTDTKVVLVDYGEELLFNPAPSHI